MHKNRFTSGWRLLCAIGLTAVALSTQAKDHVATLTMLDGPATLIHGAAKLVAAEGAAIEAEDIVETAPAATFARLEFGDGTVLDLGPGTRILVKPSLANAGDGAKAYVLSGWAKLSMDKPSAAVGKALLATPVLDVVALDRDVVLSVQGSEAGVFAMSTPVATLVRGKTPKPVQVKVDRGGFLARKADGAVESLPRPPQAFIQAVPRAFMDTLPTRAAAFAGREVKLKPAGKPSYAELEAWLNAEPRIRTRFVTRWRPLVQDDAFRKALAAQMSQHPEWHPILYPPPAQPLAQSGRKPHFPTEAVKP